MAGSSPSAGPDELPLSLAGILETPLALSLMLAVLCAAGTCKLWLCIAELSADRCKDERRGLPSAVPGSMCAAASLETDLAIEAADLKKEGLKAETDLPRFEPESSPKDLLSRLG